MKIINSFKFMLTSFENLTDNFSDKLHGKV